MIIINNGKNEETKKASELQTQVSTLNNEVTTLQDKINTISETVKTNNTVDNSSTNTTTKNSNSNTAGSSNNSNNTVTNNGYKKYVGTWYENEANSHPNEHQNPTTLKITSTDTKQMTIDLYITRTVELDNVKVNMDSNYGKFEATEERLGIPGEPEGRVKGNIKLFDNTIQLEIDESTVMYLDSGTTFNFNYKK